MNNWLGRGHAAGSTDLAAEAVFLPGRSLAPQLVAWHNKNCINHSGGRLSEKPVIKIIVAVIVLFGSYFLGYTVGHHNLAIEKNLTPKIVNTQLRQPRQVDFSLFWDVWETVNQKFAGSVNNQKMIYEAINGALASLDDPYTLFLPPDQAKRFNEDLQGSFDGIGAEIEKRDNAVTVVAPLEGSPAEKAGLKPKDIILKIDEAETKDMSLEEAIGKIRGKKASLVKLTVFRAGVEHPIELSITRGTIVVKSVKSAIKDGNIGYIKINQFGADTKELMNQVVDEMLAKKPKALIVDVRNNPGGFLDTAVDVVSLFVKDRGAIVKEQNRAGQVTEVRATLNAKLTDLPTTVLVNAGSASASEIFAGALQDYGRAKLIGEKTFGKGSVQELDDVKGGGAVRVTIAKWLTPKDRQINKLGITPDIEVKLTDDDAKNNRDPQYDRAVQELSK